jgi:outer membrane biosynthesis protein TonB
MQAICVALLFAFSAFDTPIRTYPEAAKAARIEGEVWLTTC